MNKDEYREPEWTSAIPDDQWSVYLDAIRVTRKAGAPFVLGGAFGLAAYTGRWRNTKDLDFFVCKSDKDKIVDALTKAEFDDFYSTLPYDRGWIYRAVRDSVVVDTIWQTPNRRTQVDEEWFKRAEKLCIRGEKVLAIPAEELLAIKLYVMQRDRCDWPDLINLLYFRAGALDWPHLIGRMRDDLPLLKGLLQVFDWVAPAKAAAIPPPVRERLGLGAVCSAELARPEEERVRLLDSRSWFAPSQPMDRPMELK